MPENLAFLFTAYSVVWLLLFAYLFFLSRSVAELRDEVERLKGLWKEKAEEIASPRGGVAED